MANEQNLVSFGERTPSERRRIATKAGKASGAARRKIKTFRLAAKYQLIEEDENGETAIWRIIARLIEAAENGDIKAAEFLRDIHGEKPTDKLEASVSRKSAPVIIFDIPKPDDVPDQEAGS